MGFLYKAPVNFTGSNAAGLPLANPTMPVPGAVRWFDASAIRANPGTAVTSWSDSTGTGPALAATNGQPTLELVDGLRAVRFQSAIMQQSIQLAQPHSLVLAFKLVSAPAAVVTIAGSMVRSGTDGGFVQMNGVGELYANAGSVWKAATGVSARWHRLILSFDGVNSRMLLDGVSSTGDPGALPRAMFSLGGFRNASFSDIAVSQASLFSRALTTGEMATLDGWLVGHTA